MILEAYARAGVGGRGGRAMIVGMSGRMTIVQVHFEQSQVELLRVMSQRSRVPSAKLVRMLLEAWASGGELVVDAAGAHIVPCVLELGDLLRIEEQLAASLGSTSPEDAERTRTTLARVRSMRAQRSREPAPAASPAGTAAPG